MAFDFTGKVVVVTGASGNLGRTVVQGFADAGAKIALVDLNAERLDQVVGGLGGDANRFKSFPGDLSSTEKVDALVNQIVEQFGQIDVLAHTVGGFDAGKSIHEAGVDVLDKMMAMNVYPIFLMGGRVARHMVEKGVQGKIVFILAKAGQKGAKGMGAYTASKAAAYRLMESLSAELKDFGINVNGISPSIIDTPPNRQAMPNADFDKWVTAGQLADAVMFLASEQASAIHGTNLEVFGRV